MINVKFLAVWAGGGNPAGQLEANTISRGRRRERERKSLKGCLVVAWSVQENNHNVMVSNLSESSGR